MKRMRKRLMIGFFAAVVVSLQSDRIELAAAQASPEPVEITAQEGLEWRQTEKALIAEGSVVLTRGTTKLQAHTVSAYYRDDTAGDRQEVYRVDASGSVQIASDGATGYGDNAAYDLDQGVFVLTGNEPRLEATNLTVTASQNLEYWEQKKLAVARGGAVAESGNRKIVADILSAYVEPSGDDRSKLQRVEAIGAVVITTPDDTAKGQEAVYVAATGLATLCGEVEIRRGANVLRGKCAEVNLNTGVSRLVGGGGNVTGLVQQEGN
jgi:lipopolysaccharide export system protein LptA